MKNKYTATALGLYINYIVHGMGVLILSQNTDSLQAQWGTDPAGVAKVISMLGIGRLLAILISGRLSDKFGRKPFIFLGMFTYSAFFIGILFSPSVFVACIFGVIAGLANSFLDAGTYPALMESFPKKAGTANVLLKAFIQIGQFGLPFMVVALTNANAWYGWSFVLAIAIFAINAIFLLKRPFPDQDAQQAADGKAPEVVTATKFKSKPKMWVEGICFVLYGYVSQATFYLIANFIAQYGENVADMTKSSSLLLISYYSTGSLVCVAFTALVAQKVRPVLLVVVYTLISFITITTMWMIPTPLICQIGSFVVGFSAAGGVMQLGLTVMGELFPAGKGTITGIFYTLGSVASFTVPLIASEIAKTNVQNIMLFDAVIAGVGFVLAIIIYIRYKQTVVID
ncbi:MFS transporter [Isobaculum melis]|uniref:Sugar phosphate permease n=1 Tax=Isobaculum melis TaxID=142588 RepID=A0A1H9U748_9LACT|nr:MFS transporter [Isobaculum melis]SES04964.1 Sugar phosphate permease [Isobaculum melis]